MRRIHFPGNGTAWAPWGCAPEVFHVSTACQHATVNPIMSSKQPRCTTNASLCRAFNRMRDRLGFYRAERTADILVNDHQLTQTMQHAKSDCIGSSCDLTIPE